MGTKIFLYALGIWFIFVIVAILNGAFRNLFLEPKIGEYAGHVISTIILVCVILIVTYLFVANLKIDYTRTDLLLIGAFWLILTILFEFVFFHYIMGESWNTLLANYNILKGRLFPLILLTEFIAPLLFGSILQKKVLRL